MSIDASLVGRAFPAPPPLPVTTEAVVAFAEALGTTYEVAGGLPPTFPIVVTFAALQDFLAAEELDLSRIVHGDQGFRYERPLVIGDVLTAALTVTGVRTVGGNDIIKTSSAITDASGVLVCTATATIVHRGATA